MEVTITDIEKYLEEVKEAVNAGRYRFEINDNRKDNQDLFIDYLISEERKERNTIESYGYGLFGNKK